MKYTTDSNEFKEFLDQLEEDIQESIQVLLSATGAGYDNPYLCGHFACEQSKFFTQEIKKSIIGFVRSSPFLPGNK